MYRVGKEEINAMAEVVRSRELFRINDGSREVSHFEKEWAEMVGTKYALCMSGGTSALISALVGLETGPGDEVIIPGYTFMATALAVLAVGAIPVIAEIDDSLTIDIGDLEKKISKYTKVIIPVHMMGFPCNMDKIMIIAEKYGLKIVEDSCQADGGSYKGKRLGSIGHVGAFSFNYFKILTAGEGGALTTNEKKVYERALVYHDGGTAFRPYAQELSIPVFCGVQYRSNEIAGAMLRKQLGKLEGILSDLRRIKKQLMEGLANRVEVKFIESNDIDGDCGTTLAMLFESEEKARLFAEGEGINGWLPIDSGKHVYCNWDPVLEKRGAHHPELNPYNMLQNKGRNMNYSKTMCPKTLNILSRTVYISLNPDWSQNKVENLCNKCCSALENEQI